MVAPSRNALLRTLALSSALAFMLAACGEGGEQPPAEGVAPADQPAAGSPAIEPDAAGQQ